MIPKPSKFSTHDPASRLTSGGARTPDEQAIAAMLSRLPASRGPDDLAVERAWRRVVAPAARSSRPHWAWIPAVAVVAVLMLVLGRPLFYGTTPSAELAVTAGGVFSGQLAASWHTSERGEALRETDRLRTDETGRAVFRIGGVAAVLVRENSDVGLERLHKGTFLRLSRGALTARVSKRVPDEPFVVETDRFKVTVVGTLFTVEQGPGDVTAVAVREGVVEVSDRLGRVDRVLAGHRWTSESRDARSVDSTPDAVKTLLEDGLAGKPVTALVAPFAAMTTALALPAPVPTPIPPAAPHARHEPSAVTSNVSAAPAPVVIGMASASPTSVAASPRETAPSVPASTPQVATPIATAGAVITSSPIVDDPAPPPPAPVVVASASAAPAVALPPEEGPYAHGLALEARGDLEGAARELKRASDEDPAHGDIALYALGRLAQRRLHDASRASAAYHLYRTRYPHGPLLPEVDLGILELEVDSHSDAAALADSTRFLATHPTSERKDQVHLLRGNLLRDAGNCREALTDYAAVRAVALTDHAVYSTAYCQRKLGDRVVAAATLRDYLTRFPAGAHRVEAERALAEDR